MTFLSPLCLFCILLFKVTSRTTGQPPAILGVHSADRRLKDSGVPPVQSTCLDTAHGGVFEPV
jgi:hypothetical protein